MSILDLLPPLPPEGNPPNLPEHLEALRADELELLVRLYNGPTPEDLETLRGDRRLWSQMAWIDVYPWLAYWFQPTRGWRPDWRRSGPIEGTASIGVAWAFDGIHTEGGVLNGLPPTGRDVRVQGLTVMGPGRDRDEYGFEMWRYIDWIGLYSQLGLAMNWRVPITMAAYDPDDPYDSYDPRLPPDPPEPESPVEPLP